MKQYLDLALDVLATGVDKSDRTGTGTRSVFGRQMRFDLSKGFPLLTTKKLHFKSIAIELLWLISGSTNIQFMKDNGVTIWDEWATPEGELGPVYGKQWRQWSSFEPEYPDLEEGYGHGKVVDQLAQVIERIKTNPDCRRLIVSAWNPADIPKMALPPCHAFFQFWTRELTLEERRKMATPGIVVYNPAYADLDPSTMVDQDLDKWGIPRRALSCHMYQRSADTFLGVPYNIASYALLTHMVAHLTGLQVGEFIHSLGDVHFYKNHFDQINEQLKRSPRPLPTLRIGREVKSIDDFKYEDLILEGYDPHPAIKAEVSV